MKRYINSPKPNHLQIRINIPTVVDFQMGGAYPFHFEVYTTASILIAQDVAAVYWAAIWIFENVKRLASIDSAVELLEANHRVDVSTAETAVLVRMGSCHPSSIRRS